MLSALGIDGALTGQTDSVSEIEFCTPYFPLHPHRPPDRAPGRLGSRRLRFEVELVERF